VSENDTIRALRKFADEGGGPRGATPSDLRSWANIILAGGALPPEAPEAIRRARAVSP
jgi:hypothetical protein